MHKNVKSIVAKALAFTLVVTAVGTLAPAAESDAAKKPKLSKTKVNVAVKKSAKITIKNVKAKKVKKLTVKSAKKSIATVKKNGRTKFTITGKKAGSTTVTAKVKVGKKTTTLKVKVTVKKAVVKTEAPKASASATASATTAPSQAPATTEPVTPTEAPTPTPNIGDVIFNDTFEDGTFQHVSARAASTEPPIEITENGYEGKGFLVTKRTSNAQGALIDLSNIAEPGATYEFSAWVRIATELPKAGVILSSETQTVATGDKTFANHYVVTTKSSNGVGGAATLIAGDPSEWHQVTYTVTAPDDIYHFGLYFETGNDAVCDMYLDNVSLKLVGRNTPDESIPSLKEEYKDIFPYFGGGVGYDQFMGENAGKFVISQYNSVTMGNEMKPDAIMGTEQDENGNNIRTISLDAATEKGYTIPENYGTFKDNQNSKGEVLVPNLNFTKTDLVLEKAYKTGTKLRFHTLVWHQQMPVYFFKSSFKTGNSADNASIEAMNARTEFYAKTVLDHVLAKEKELTGGNGSIVYAVDVVNEYFHSHNAADSEVNTNGLTFWEEIYGKDADGNYIYDQNNAMSTEPEYVKIAFKAAYDTIKKYGKENDISLIYNDYNTYGENTADNIVTMIEWLNTKDDINTDGDKICDGVGMQAHLAMDQDYHSPAKFKIAVDKFMAANLELQVTELDITNSDKSTDETLAATYKEIMKILVDAKKAGGNISSVTLWSLYDATSWRASKNPCVFKGLYNAKPAFWSLVELAKESK